MISLGAKYHWQTMYHFVYIAVICSRLLLDGRIDLVNCTNAICSEGRFSVQMTSKLLQAQPKTSAWMGCKPNKRYACIWPLDNGKKTIVWNVIQLF